MPRVPRRSRTYSIAPRLVAVFALILLAAAAVSAIGTWYLLEAKGDQREAAARNAVFRGVTLLNREIGRYVRGATADRADNGGLSASTRARVRRLAMSPLAPAGAKDDITRATNLLTRMEMLIIGVETGAINGDAGVRAAAIAYIQYLDHMRAYSLSLLADERSATRSAARRTDIMIVAVAVSTVVILCGLIILALVTVRSVAGPIKRLEGQARLLGRERVDFRQVAAGGPEELQEIARLFAAFSADIRREIDLVRGLVEKQQRAAEAALRRMEEQARQVAQAESSAQQMAAEAMGELMTSSQGLALFERLGAGQELATESAGRLQELAAQWEEVATAEGVPSRAQLRALAAALDQEATGARAHLVELQQTADECRVAMTTIFAADEEVTAELEELLALISESHDGLLAAQGQAEGLSVALERVELALRRIRV